VGGLFGWIEGERVMAIRWEIYHRVQDFKLIDAAFLWLEIEPSEELLASPPYTVRTMQQVLNDAVNDITSEKLIQHAKKAAEKEGISKVDVLKRLFSNPPKRRPIILNEFAPPENLSPRDMAQELVRIFGIDSDSLTENSWEDLTRQWNTNTNLEKVVSRDHLMEVAEAWNESPKFLFPEMMKDIAKITASDSEDKPLNPKKRNSYLRLIKGLLNRVSKSHPGEVTAKELSGWVKDAGEELGQDAIRAILKEIKEEFKP
jgi:hypothetical protein